MLDQYEQFLSTQFSQDFYAPWLASLGDAPSLSIRFNPYKKIDAAYLPIASTVSHCDQAAFLSERPSFILDPNLHGGAYYVQDSNSMIIAEVFKKLRSQLSTENCLVLDMCAAPGGKSTHLAAGLENGDLLVANEIIHSRVGILQENLSKWGLPNFCITSADAKQFGVMENTFDIIVADMPCSGEGMFRKNEKAVHEWSISNVELCAARQKRIAMDLWPALKTGGYFIYSTCTFNAKENRENLAFIMEETGAELVQLNQKFALQEDLPGMYYLFPPHSTGEGLFFAVLQKTVRKENTKTAGQKNSVKEWKNTSGIWNKSGFISVEHKEILYQYHENAAVHFENLFKMPGLRNPGFALAKIIRKEMKWNAFSPLSVGLETNAEAEINLENASEVLAYLRRDNILPDTELGAFLQSCQQKQALIMYRQLPIGWIFKAGNRWNNSWPMEWRVLKK